MTAGPNIVREALRLSQTDETPDPYKGLHYAVMAYDMAQDSEIRVNDPTARGEAAAKAGFRAQQAGSSPDVVIDWFYKSDAALPHDVRGKRERVGTYTLEGRALSLRLLKSALGNAATSVDPALKLHARDAFEDAEDFLKSQHTQGSKWDRYGTMSARHRATYEAIFGAADLAATTALRGMWRAIRAENEANPAEEHRTFVKKQFTGNVAAATLAATRMLTPIPWVRTKRLERANRLLG